MKLPFLLHKFGAAVVFIVNDDDDDDDIFPWKAY